jgi:flagellar biosynthesis protein FlhF
MLVKRYFAHDMQEAMDMIVKELGSDAIILNTQKTRKKGWENLFKKPVLEVMVAYDPAKIPAKRVIPAPPAANGFTLKPPRRNGNSYQSNAYNNVASGGAPLRGEGNGQSKTPAAETEGEGHSNFAPLIIKTQVKDMEGIQHHDQTARLAQLDSRLNSLNNILSEFISKFSYVKREVTYDFSADVEKLFLQLLAEQVKEEFAHSLAKEAEIILKKTPETTALEAMEHLIIEKLGSPAPVQTKKFRQKVIVLIGPTGVGKTTSLVKLAADFSVKHKKKVGIINTDTYRIAAQEQLKTYSDILSIPLHMIYKVDEMVQVLENMSDRDIIFVDTAGKRPGDKQHMEDISKMLAFDSPLDILLCVPVSISFEALKEVIDSYAFIDDFKLIITKMDETKYRGMILNLCWYANKPLAYATTGQNVPDDIEIINIQNIADGLLGNKQ